MFRRIISNTRKQIFRSGWTAWASVSVMTLAFMVATIFLALAFFAHLNIRKIESRNNMIVFFEVGMDQEIVNRLWEKWRGYDKIKEINYLTEESAYQIFSDYTARVSPIHYETLKSFREPKLNSSLDIKLIDLNDFETLKSQLQKDIEEENNKLIITPASEAESDTLPTSFPVENPLAVVKYKYSFTDGKPPIILKSDDTRLEQQREIFGALRVGGIAIIVLLFVVIFFFTFMTVEFRLYNQMEEIGVMQLVGGSLFFIRSPYILEGGFYGFIGALISNIVLGGIFLLVFILDNTSAISRFFFENFSDLEWPFITPLGWILILLAMSLLGGFLGGISSFFSIRRYIR